MRLLDRSKFHSEKTKQVPIWFMRQAGRYHAHYQNIRKKYSFMQMCKTPEVAAEITFGPIEDFDFDAAILFSDLLFPLELINMGLSYESGPPTLSFHLKGMEDLKKLQLIEEPDHYFQFQRQALKLIRQGLAQDKSLLGFVGAPFTLFAYAADGGHHGNLVHSKTGLYNGLYQNFLEILLPTVKSSMSQQAEGGCDVMAIFDTAAGELSPEDYRRFVVPTLVDLANEFKKNYPQVKLLYYSRNTHMGHLKSLNCSAIDILGVDWRHSYGEVLQELGRDYFIQGNIDPHWLFLPWNQLQENLIQFLTPLKNNPLYFEKGIFSLGHGVLPQTPEENVRKTISFVRNFLKE